MQPPPSHRATESSPYSVRNRSIPSHILWRSCLGFPAAWSSSGSNSRGVYLIDDTDADAEEARRDLQNGKSRMRRISSDKRMFHLPCSLRDIGNNRFDNDDLRLSRHNNNLAVHGGHSYLQLLPQPRIVGATLSTSRRFSSTGISCMDLDKGYDLNSSTNNSPPRYLLVGSGGGDCSLCLYDVSYFGSDEYLNQNQQQQQHNIHNTQQTKSTIASMTHRPIARSIRDSNNTAITDISGVPNGHRQPILGTKWYPADVYGSFVSASISGEVLIWDAQQFVPVFATYTHVYTGPTTSAVADEESNKSVAPLKCMDLPKTPEGCPHGSALLALGLGGGDGRGVIQLCDAFRGGSATHELIGHTGGVNCVEWDPQHPFRLASAGEDCTIRLWDIRKAGASACLGVLDREKGMCGDDDDYVSSKTTLVQPSPKKRRLGVQQHHHINDLSRFQGVESHGVPVSSVAFTPSGDELVSAGVDGKIFHWDLRPDTHFQSAEAALRRKLRQGGAAHDSVDPAVSMEGRLYPTVFAAGESRSRNLGSSKRTSFRRNKTVLAISQDGSRDTATLFASTTSVSRDSKIHGYSLSNGTEQFALDGHLGDVTCLLPVSNFDNRRVNCCDETRYDVKLLTGGKDGVVLSWGSPVGRSSCRNANDDQGGYGGDDGREDNDVISFLRRQRQQRRINFRLRDRDTGDSTSLAESGAQDLDTW